MYRTRLTEETVALASVFDARFELGMVPHALIGLPQ